jgi:hypothetical protein
VQDAANGPLLARLRHSALVKLKRTATTAFTR